MKRVKTINHISLSFSRVGGTVNGVTLAPRVVNYSRREYSDGTYTEDGLPTGMASRPTMEQLMAWVFAAPRLEVRKKKGRR